MDETFNAKAVEEDEVQRRRSSLYHSIKRMFRRMSDQDNVNSAEAGRRIETSVNDESELMVDDQVQRLLGTELDSKTNTGEKSKSRFYSTPNKKNENVVNSGSNEKPFQKR